MNRTPLYLLSFSFALNGAHVANASLATWQVAVGVGTAPVTTVFTPTSGASPALVNVGTLSGDRSFEFIYNAGPTVAGSQALLGSQAGASGVQGLKADQWQNSGVYGMTDFGVADYYSTTPYLLNQDVHIVYASDGVDTMMYVNGGLAHTFVGVDLTITDVNALAAASNPTHTAFFDNLAGDVLGFASYDAALSAAEVSAHYNAFVIPEPGTPLLALAVAGFATMRRRR